MGGRNGKDSTSATSFHLSNGKIAPVEIIESEFPTQVELFEFLRDSSGPGRLGFVREFRILQDEFRFSMRTDKHALASQGINGGHPGGAVGCIINSGEEYERSMPSRFGDQRLNTGDVLRVERPGDGGLGAAFERSPEAVLEDVRQGYVSVERARTTTGSSSAPTAGRSRCIRTRLGVCVLSSMNRKHRMLRRIGGRTVKTENELLKRITAWPDVFGGEPIVRDMRISVEFILSLLAQGVSHEEILEELPRPGAGGHSRLQRLRTHRYRRGHTGCGIDEEPLKFLVDQCAGRRLGNGFITHQQARPGRAPRAA